MMLCGPRISYRDTGSVVEACLDLWLNTGHLGYGVWCRHCQGFHLTAWPKRRD